MDHLMAPSCHNLDEKKYVVMHIESFEINDIIRCEMPHSLIDKIDCCNVT